MKKLFLLPATLLVIAGCGLPKSDAVDIRRGCMKTFGYNYTYDDINGARVFSSVETVKGVTKSEAMDRASEFITSNGMQILSSNAATGVINASKIGVVPKKGDPAPYIVEVANMSDGVQITTKSLLPTSSAHKLDQTRAFMCATVDAVEEGKYL